MPTFDINGPRRPIRLKEWLGLREPVCDLNPEWKESSGFGRNQVVPSGSSFKHGQSRKCTQCRVSKVMPFSLNVRKVREDLDLAADRQECLGVSLGNLGTGPSVANKACGNCTLNQTCASQGVDMANGTPASASFAHQLPHSAVGLAITGGRPEERSVDSDS
jgi:hypothetical protein